MIYVRIVNDLPVQVSKTLTTEQHQDPAWQNRWDWKDFATVEKLATYLTAMTGKTHLPVDRGNSVSPQFDVIEAPAVGDPVSQGFNGDYYPEGVIVKITPGWQITTSTGKKFIRRKNSSTWLRVGGTFAMVAGHIDERNPHF